MRPIIDTNNLWYSDETFVYNSRVTIVLRVFILIIILISGLYLLSTTNYLFSVVAFLVFFTLFKNTIKLITERNSVQLTISIDGIKVKNEPLISWSNIEKERIIVIKLGKSSEHDFAFYDTANHKEVRFRVERLNIDHQELLKSTVIHRERFNRKTIQINPVQ